MRLHHYIILSTVLLSSIFGIRWLFYQGYIRLNYPSKIQYPIRGIDISHHQGDIDWGLLKQYDLYFVFIKATEGGDFKDSLFKKNLKEAQNIQLQVGAYHFYTLCRPWRDQFDNFTQSVAPKPGHLPPAVDLEFGGNCSQRPSKQVFIKEIKHFLLALEDAYKAKPIIYVTPEFYRAYLAGELLDYPLWFREIYKRPKLEAERIWTFWQYTNRGRLEGINAFVDLNVFNGNQKTFEKLLQP